MTVVKHLTGDNNIYNQQLYVDESGNTYISGTTTLEGVDVVNNLSATTMYGDLNWSYIQDTPTTISGYNISNAYTKTEVDDLIQGTSTGVTYNDFNTYTGVTAPSSFLSANTSYYTQSQANSNFLSADTVIPSDFYTTGEVDANFLSANTSYYTQQEVNDNFLSANTSLSGLSDVTLTNPVLGNMLVYSGGTWINSDIITNKSISKMFEGIFTQSSESFNITTSYQDIPFDYVVIKDDYYSHSATTTSIGSEITILNDGWYEINTMLGAKTDSAASGIRGNPVMNFWLDFGSGWELQPDQAGGYIREDSTNDLSCTLVGGGLFNFSGGTKLKITVIDTVATPPDESVVPYTTRLYIKYIDRTYATGLTFENIKDIVDVSANAPNDGEILMFDNTTSKWTSSVPYFLSANTFDSVINTNGINNIGNITATTYYGDGSNLTGISVSSTLSGLTDVSFQIDPTDGQVLTYSATTATWYASTIGGSITDGANLGTGYGVFAQANGSDLEFKTLVAGTNITINSSTTEITINSSGGGVDYASGVSFETAGTYLTSANVQSVIDELDDLRNKYVGLTSTLTYLDNEDGTITVHSAYCMIHDDAYFTNPLKEFLIPEKTIGIAPGIQAYITVNYSGGTPEYDIEYYSLLVNGSDKIPVLAIINFDNDHLHVTDYGTNFGRDMVTKIAARIQLTEPTAWFSGLELGGDGSSGKNKIIISGGTIWYATKPIVLDYVISNGLTGVDSNTFMWYISGSSWVQEGVDSVDSTVYNAGGELKPLGEGKYGVVWVYRYIGSESVHEHEINYMYGDETYDTLSQAKVSQLPDNIDRYFTSQNILVGKISYQSSATTTMDIQSAFANREVPIVPEVDHENFANLLGGQTNQHYHLTGTEYTTLRGGSSDASLLHNHSTLYKPLNEIYTGTTTDDTETTIHTEVIQKTGNTNIWEANITAYSENDVCGMFERKVVVYNSGTTSIKYINFDLDYQEGGLEPTSVDFVVNANGQDVDIKVTGVAATTIKWKVKIDKELSAEQ